jgi:histidinol-phosphate aminotransferase
VAERRVELTGALRSRGFEVADSQANFVWVSHPDLSGAELASRLGIRGIVVAAGDALGEPDHVRITLPVLSTGRLVDALEESVEAP